MGEPRFIATAIGLFFAVFFGMKWALTIQPLKPDPRLPTFQHYDPDSPRARFEQSDASDNDATRDRLRHDVLDYAKALGDDPCNQALRDSYIRAAVAYTRAWLSIVPCMAAETCGQSDSQRIDRAGQAFGTPLDRRVREAMQRVHIKAGFGAGDFPKDTVLAVSMMASDARINPHADARLKQMALDSSSAQDCGH